MKKYEATFEMNNGYACSCCRETWNTTKEAEFEDGTPYGDVRKYFEQMENKECDLLYIERLDVSLNDIDELQDRVKALENTTGVAFVHKKTGNIYHVLSQGVIDATNLRDGNGVVLYGKDGQLFVRDSEEFHEKFEELGE